MTGNSRGKLIGSGVVGAAAGLVALMVSRNRFKRTRLQAFSKSVLARFRRPSRRLRRALPVPGT